MESILVVNSGSTSLKLCLFCGEEQKRVQQNGEIDFKAAFEGYKNHQLTAIGHRVVHGGAKYSKSVIIDEGVEEDIDHLSSLAPLHNIPCLKAIRYCKKAFPGVLQYAVFDTAFHRTLPDYARIYAIPYSLTKKYAIERYGFHGIAHAYAYKIYEKTHGPGKLINCHLGGGSSVCAMDHGVSMDTSMGFTPNEGLMMSTRSGDVDPGLFDFLTKKGFSIEKIQKMLNYESGLLGVSEVSASMEELLKNEKGHLAIDLFCYRVLKTIGSYAAVLQGVDAISFTGGIGENSLVIREKILSSLKWLEPKVLVIKCDESSYIRDAFYTLTN